MGLPGTGGMARVAGSVTSLHALLQQIASGPSAEMCGEAATWQPSWVSALHLGQISLLRLHQHLELSINTGCVQCQRFPYT